jgi:hypothetical protein
MLVLIRQLIHYYSINTIGEITIRQVTSLNSILSMVDVRVRRVW